MDLGIRFPPVKQLTCQKCGADVPRVEMSLLGSPYQPKISSSLRLCRNCKTWYRYDKESQRWIADELAQRIVKTPLPKVASRSGTTILGPQTFEHPALKEYFFKLIRIDGIDQLGKEYCLAIHQGPLDKLQEGGDLTSRSILFCGKVRKWETLGQAIQREMLNELGIAKVISFDVLKDREDFALDRFHHRLPRCSVIVSVAYQENLKNWQNFNLSWLGKERFLGLLDSLLHKGQK